MSVFVGHGGRCPRRRGLGHELPQGSDTGPDNDTAREAAGRGRRARCDSLPQPAPGVHPAHLSPTRQVGLGSCPPTQGQRHKRSHSLRARLGQGARRGQPPSAAPGGLWNSAQRTCDHRALPQETGRLNARLPCRPGQWPSRSGLGAQAAGERPSAGQQPGAIRPIKTSMGESAYGHWCLSRDSMEGQAMAPRCTHRCS